MNRYVQKTFNTLGFLAGYSVNIIILAVCAYAVYSFASRAYDAGENFTKNSAEEKPLEEIEIVIDEETPMGDVAKILEDKGLVYNAYVYRFENFLKGSRDPYSPGTYLLNTQMGSPEIDRTLRNTAAPSPEIKITIAEGRTIKEIAQYLEEQGLMTAQEFIETCDRGNFKYDFLSDVPYRENRLEGYLFPDTYFVSEKPAASEIIDKMLYRFQQMYDEECMVRAMEMGMRMDEVIIAASIIEKEIMRAEEREMASAVIRNRLADGMKLQMCSTVIYILEKRKDRLLDEDLRIESPYNTYLNGGLPYGPIGNPGKACILAALNPGDYDYLYFVVKDENTGEHVFTNDFDEFTDAKARYNQRF